MLFKIVYIIIIKAGDGDEFSDLSLNLLKGLELYVNDKQSEDYTDYLKMFLPTGLMMSYAIFVLIY